MRILMMTNSYFPYLGGLERSLRVFSEELRKLGHEVLIAAPEPVGRTDKKEKVVRLPALHHNDQRTEFSINLPLPWPFAKIMEEFRPDIIHSHYPFFMGDYALRLSRQYHVPLVFTYHVMFEHYVHYLPVHNEGVKKFLIALAVGYANMCQQIVAPTASVRSILIARKIKTPIAVIPTGVDVKALAKGKRADFRRKYKIPSNVFVVGHVSRLAPEKNMAFMVAALIIFLEKNPHVHVLIVGRGPSKGMIRKQFKQAGLQNRLHLTGYLDGQDLIDAYHAMDIFSFASLSETQGIVLLEALSAGVPVVALEAQGVRDIIKNYVNGRLIKNQDQQKFIAALQWCLVLSKNQFKLMRQRASSSAQHYAISECALRMEKLYKKLILKSRSSQFDKGSWKNFENQVKTDWDILMNVVKAVEAGVHNER